MPDKTPSLAEYAATQKRGAAPCWLCGLPERQEIEDGSTESDNRYAGVMLAGQAVPSQRLQFVDPDRGRVSSVYKVWLDA